MANATDVFATSVHGTNPQYLVEKITRLKIYNSVYWKEECFGLTAATLLEKAVELKYYGGTYGGTNNPTKFLCLLLKTLQLQPEKDIIYEFIKNEDFPYLRVLGAFYLRLTGKSEEIYTHLEPLYNDYRKLIFRGSTGYTVTYMDEFIDSLLRDELVCSITLPHLIKRIKLEQQVTLEPRRSTLEDELMSDEEQEEEEQFDEDTDNEQEETNKYSAVEEDKQKMETEENLKNSSAVAFDEDDEDEILVKPPKVVSPAHVKESFGNQKGDDQNGDTDTKERKNDEIKERQRSRSPLHRDEKEHRYRRRSRSDSRSNRRYRDRDYDRKRRSRSRSPYDRRRKDSRDRYSRRRDRSRSRSDSDDSYQERKRKRSYDDGRKDSRDDYLGAKRDTGDEKKREVPTTESRTKKEEIIPDVEVSGTNAGQKLNEKQKKNEKIFDKMFGKKPAASASKSSSGGGKVVGKEIIGADGKKYIITAPEGTVEYWNQVRESLGMKKLK
jgi:pre-mRNA-splicing factor 38A